MKTLYLECNMGAAGDLRMAALSARLSSPKKGDRPDELQAEYLRLAAEANALKRQSSV